MSYEDVIDILSEKYFIKAFEIHVSLIKDDKFIPWAHSVGLTIRSTKSREVPKKRTFCFQQNTEMKPDKKRALCLCWTTELYIMHYIGVTEAAEWTRHAMLWSLSAPTHRWVYIHITPRNAKFAVVSYFVRLWYFYMSYPTSMGNDCEENRFMSGIQKKCDHIWINSDTKYVHDYIQSQNIRAGFIITFRIFGELYVFRQRGFKLIIVHLHLELCHELRMSLASIRVKLWINNYVHINNGI